MRRIYVAAALVGAALSGCVSEPLPPKSVATTSAAANPYAAATQPSSGFPATGVVFNGNRYFTQEKVTEAVRQDWQVRAMLVDPAPQKLNSALLLALPSRQAIQAVNAEVNKGQGDLVVNMATDIGEAKWLGQAKAIEFSKLFNTVTTVRVADTGAEAFANYGYKLWPVHGTGDQWKWFLAKNGGGSRELVFDGPLGGGNIAVQMSNFNISILNAAAELGAPVTHQNFATAPAGPSSSGTVFFIDGTGHALTNAHVTEGCRALKIAMGDGVEKEARVVATDRGNDLSLLKVDQHSGSYAVFRSSPPVQQGEDVVAYGYPLAGAFLSVSGNLSIGIVSALSGVREDTRRYQISAPVQVGNSGGPLFDAGGNVIGVVDSKLNATAIASMTGDVPQNVNFAIKMNIVAGFLEANGIKYETTQFKATMPTTKITERARGFTFLVKCQK